jgi:NADH-quinone oxidoreductase subunit H
MSAVVVTLFFGGPDGPGFHFLRWLWPIAWFLGKTFVFLYVQVWIRAALPRMRYDQLMDLGWKILIPISLAWLLIITALIESRAFGIAICGVCIVGALALSQAVRVARRRRSARESFVSPGDIPPPPVGRVAELRALGTDEGEVH